MRSLILVRVLFPSLTKALVRGAAALLLIGVFMTGGSGPAQAATVRCPASGTLGPGTGNDDLLIDGKADNGMSVPICKVGDGPYHYLNVNIINNGKLVFEETANTFNIRIHFWAKSILVENGGSLIAGSTPGDAAGSGPFGTYNGVLTIHLYGADQTNYDGMPIKGGVGITCQSNNAATNPPCGIPSGFWGANAYDPLPFDNGVDPITQSVGYFGYKVLAVSYGGTLHLFGKKGAFYGTSLGSQDLDPQDSGISWLRLAGTISPTTPPDPKLGPSLTVVNPTPRSAAPTVNWGGGDHIVVTTTDYLPSHSEELVICSITGNTIYYDTAYDTKNIEKPAPCPATIANRAAVQWTHNGEQYPLANRASPLKPIPKDRNITKAAAETRAAVGLLTRSIRIVSEGDTFGDCFPPSHIDASKGCTKDDPRTKYYFGGHTIVRQGFAAYQVQGVEFRQMGQGGKAAHYPIHFHMVQKTLPNNAYVKDSSVNESMTRWITVHGTQDVLVERNVGYLSIGHGFYLEDAVETDNKLYSNLGVYARAAVENAKQNPREVPGILSSPDDNRTLNYNSDVSAPSLFWITNGWNDFQGNMAAGAGMCGVCYWEVAGVISGASRNVTTWTSYASEQTPGRAGTSPLKNFNGNYCTSAMFSFQTVGDAIPLCPGIGTAAPNIIPKVPNPLAPNTGASKDNGNPALRCGPGTVWPLCPSDYYPNHDPGQLGHATKCPGTGLCDQANAPQCTNDGDPGTCLPTVINNYTSSFNWAPYNFSALWLRRRWHLVSNSFISDVQNAGLTFVSGGDYTRSSAAKGLWELALQTVFAGQTQPDDMNHAFASVLSPFNTQGGLPSCDNKVSNPNVPYSHTDSYCISADNGFVLTDAGFGVSQHIFNIYDGPAIEHSNAFLDIKKKDLGTTSNNFVYSNLLGVPKATPGTMDPMMKPIPPGNCYMQNAAIAWKQPNAFYYPPNFRSKNLFFDNVDIRHYVIVPQFLGDSYSTDPKQAMDRYCAPNQNNGMFNGFSSIDRQTELTDDDGSLTGYAGTSSVNQDKFFTGPIEGPECQSDGSVPTTEGGTAKTSPYNYVTTVVYPDQAKDAPDPPPPSPPCNPAPPKTCHAAPYQVDPNWDSSCSDANCFGVPLYRLYQTDKEKKASMAPGYTPPSFIRMAGFNICQRQSMSANHGHYFVDLTASDATQKNWPTTGFLPNLPPECHQPDNRPIPPSRNVFVGGQTYDFFHVYATKDTEQTFSMYVGTNFNLTDLKKIRVNISSGRFKICVQGDPDCPVIGDADTVKVLSYLNGILTVNLNQSAFAKDFEATAQDHCVPKLFCTWNTFLKKCVGTGAFSDLSQADRNATCAHAGEDVDCPQMVLKDRKTKVPGCVGFSIKLPVWDGKNGFLAKDQTATIDPMTHMNLPMKYATCFPKDDQHWNVPLKIASPDLAGTACYKAKISTDWCQ